MLEPLFISIFILFTAAAGYYFRLLTLSGSIAAFIIGAATGWGFGLYGLLVLGFFFASSSIWSKFKGHKKEIFEKKHAKGSRRDWQQVAANGGTAAIASILNLLMPSPVWLMAFLISLAAANSDTWASEIGSLNKKPPLSLRTWKPIETGTSGAVSLLGTFAAIAGSFAIALLSLMLFSVSFYEALLIGIFGFAGNLIDSILGAFFQAEYKCLVCSANVEKTEHCGQPASLIKGRRFADNDFVNFFSGLASALLGMFIYIICI
ncbi:hypothetical protein AF332_09660 [Sporosarcina globispora]|uniref:Transmenbrane protein n=1 Tax=Sporosarcina globispora TaxID=1459 RepID=A0A0M0GAX6_SPOGL|nr:DUF92 domain-containing protein [Sporosarcina globispora]KON87050.1 hypothetical protein AF332_09660 [Sporosarcina globispora]